MIEARLSRLENMCKNKETLLTQSLTTPNSFNHIDENQVSWNLEDFDQDSISPQNLELDQYQPIDKLTSFHFNEIELEYECEPNSQLCDSIPIFESMLTVASLPKLDTLPEPTLILVSMDFEIELLLLDCHTSLMGIECEVKFFDLDSTLELKPTLEPKVDFPGLVLVPELFISKPNSSIL